MRQQAERQLRMNLVILLLLVGATAGTAAFAWQPPADTTVRMALIANAKPAPAGETEAETADEITVINLDESPQSVDVSAISSPRGGPTVAIADNVSTRAEAPEALAVLPTLPGAYDQLEPSTELREETTISSLTFSNDVDDNYRPIAPRRVFGEGFFTVYATFSYAGMADGMVWAWVWRYNGEVLPSSNEEVWSYGADGPGYVFYNPPEGFAPGEYTLEVWVNGELFQQSAITIEASVANQ